MSDNSNKSVIDEAMNDEISQSALAAKKLKKTKIIIISVFAGMLAFMLCCLLIPGFLNMSMFEEKKNSDDRVQYIFHDPYPDTFNIMNYEEYKRLDRGFYYLDDSTGQTSELERDDLVDYNSGVKVLYNMFEAIIAGDADAYNALLSDNIEPKDDFTQQQVYKIHVTSIDNRDSKSDGYNFKVEYQIHENNGTFRTDIGSDMAKIQYFTIRKIDGKYLIDSITESNNK